MAHHGFEEILFIGDSGGDQNGMQEVADLLTAEWGADGPTKVYALLDYYRKGQEWSRAWLQAAYGYDMTTIGTHAGISDTSAVWFVFPEGIRAELRYPYGGSPDAGVTGDPTKASAEIGRMVCQPQGRRSPLAVQVAHGATPQRLARSQARRRWPSSCPGSEADCHGGPEISERAHSKREARASAGARLQDRGVQQPPLALRK